MRALYVKETQRAERETRWEHDKAKAREKKQQEPKRGRCTGSESQRMRERWDWQAR